MFPRKFLWLIWLSTSSLIAADVDFVRDVRPIFDTHCTKCHGPEQQESGLRLDIKALALKGGDNQGPDIVPGQADASPLIHLVRSTDPNTRMPPEGPGLSKSEIELLQNGSIKVQRGQMALIAPS